MTILQPCIIGNHFLSGNTNPSPLFLFRVAPVSLGFTWIPLLVPVSTSGLFDYKHQKLALGKSPENMGDQGAGEAGHRAEVKLGLESQDETEPLGGGSENCLS